MNRYYVKHRQNIGQRGITMSSVEKQCEAWENIVKRGKIMCEVWKNNFQVNQPATVMNRYNV